MKTKTSIEIVGGVMGIVVGAIVVFQFVRSESWTNGDNGIREARLQDIASVVEAVTGNQAVRLTSNYDTPLRMLFSAHETAKTGVNLESSKERGVTVIDEPGSALLIRELQTALENKFGKWLPITLDSSVSSIYNELYPD